MIRIRTSAGTERTSPTEVEKEGQKQKQDKDVKERRGTIKGFPKRITADRMDPPSWVPKVIEVPTAEGFTHSRDFIKRRGAKGRIRISGMQYVSPVRSKKFNHPMWRVRYNRKGVVFSTTYKSRELCGYIARLVHALADPGLVNRGFLINDCCSVPHQKESVEHGTLVWLYGANPPTMVRVDTAKIPSLRGLPWFFVEGKGVAVCPEATLDKKGKIKISWLVMEQLLYPDSWKNRRANEAPRTNWEDQMVFDLTDSNFIKISSKDNISLSSRKSPKTQGTNNL